MDENNAQQRPAQAGAWTGDQLRALERIADFLRAPGKPVLTVAGAAGTGKSSLLGRAFENDGPETAVIAPTARAARVLRRMGISGAATAHSLLYIPVTGVLTDACALCSRPFDDGDHAYFGELNGKTIRYTCERCREKISGARSWRRDKVRFDKREALDPIIRCIVIDEASMISEEVAKDLLAFGRPVVAVGDGFQLPPIDAAPGFDLDRPDILLTEVHRQKKDSAILAAAEAVRLGELLPYGDYNDLLVKRDRDINIDELVAADKVICGTHKKRVKVTQQIRRRLGFSSELPEPGDRVICCRNNPKKGLINGDEFEVEAVSIEREPDASSDTVHMTLRSSDDAKFVPEAATPAEYFTQSHVDLPWYRRRQIDEFMFAHVVTVHKAQGSQWGTVIVYDEAKAFRHQNATWRARWRYTSITRASAHLTVVR